MLLGQNPKFHAKKEIHAHTKFQLEIPKNRGKICNDVNILKSKNWISGENSGNVSKFKKPKI